MKLPNKYIRKYIIILYKIAFNFFILYKISLFLKKEKNPLNKN